MKVVYLKDQEIQKPERPKRPSRAKEHLNKALVHAEALEAIRLHNIKITAKLAKEAKEAQELIRETKG